MGILIERLKATYNLDGELVHQPTRGDFGTVLFGKVTRVNRAPNPFTGTGFEIAESILLLQKHMVQCQEALENMERILDTAEPYTPGASKAAEPPVLPESQAVTQDAAAPVTAESLLRPQAAWNFAGGKQ